MQKRAVTRAHHAGTLTLNFHPPELPKNKCLLFEPPGLYFVIAAQARTGLKVGIL